MMVKSWTLMLLRDALRFPGGFKYGQLLLATGSWLYYHVPLTFFFGG